MTTTITICMGSSCFARGNDSNLEFIERYIEDNNINAKVEVTGARCEGKCAKGPNITVDGIEYNEVDEEKIKEILTAIK